MPRVSARDFEKSLSGSIALPHIVLLAGDNDDLKSDLFKSVCRNVAVSPDDAFRFTRLEGDSLDLDSGRLADELGAISMFGGSRLVHVRTPARLTERAIRQALEVPGEWMLLIEAPDLTEAEWLPEFARNSRLTVVDCGEEGAGDFHAFVEREFARTGLTIQPEAIERLIALVGDDRASIRAEILKLGALVGPEALVSVAAVNEAVADASAMLADEIAAAALTGENELLARSLDRLATTGSDPIQALMAAHRLAITAHRNGIRQWSTGRREKNAPAWTPAQLRALIRSLGRSIKQTRLDSANSSLTAQRALTALGHTAKARRR